MSSNRPGEKNDHYDIVVVGGGIQGILIALEAADLGKSVALVEKGDWGCATSAGWLRILHGGLRYLQSLDLVRYFESVRERRWFMASFPDFVRPLPCLMPLYDGSLRSPFVMRLGLFANDLLSMHRNIGVAPEIHLPKSGILAGADVIERAPIVRREGLRGGACWYDAVAVHPQRLLMALLRQARTRGVQTFARTKAVEVLHSNGQVSGLRVASSEVERDDVLQSSVVINSTGHWVGELAASSGIEMPRAPRMSWAWNVMFDREFHSPYALAVTRGEAGSQVLFLLSWMGKVLVGTGHQSVPHGEEFRPVPASNIAAFVAEATDAVPGLNLSAARVTRVFQGCLPAMSDAENKVLSRPFIVNHATRGLNGLISVWGVKYTTARSVAHSVMAMLGLPGNGTACSDRRIRVPRESLEVDAMLVAAARSGDIDRALLQAFVRDTAIDEEASLSSMLLSASSLGDDPEVAKALAEPIAEQMNWGDARRKAELQQTMTDIEQLQYPSTGAPTSLENR